MHNGKLRVRGYKESAECDHPDGNRDKLREDVSLYSGERDRPSHILTFCYPFIGDPGRKLGWKDGLEWFQDRRLIARVLR